MLLNYKTQGSGQPIILLHGLFGSLDNLGVIARAFKDSHQVIQIDLRNHGHSFWSDKMDFSLMAQDVLTLMDNLSLTDVILIGHSMGGKVAMQLTKMIPQRISQIIALDIAPVVYSGNPLIDVFRAIDQTITESSHDRTSVYSVLKQSLSEATTQFLLKSYKLDKWLFNFVAIKSNLDQIRSWQTGEPYFNPILFLSGEYSHYLNEQYTAEVLQQFPYAVIHTINKAGHNVHFDNPAQVISEIKQWLSR